MTRDTSIEAYIRYRDSGNRDRVQFLVYEELFDHGPETQGENGKGLPGIPQNSISPRFAELEAMGLIKIVGERICTVTGCLAYVWDVTSRVDPIPIKRTSLSISDIRGAILELDDIDKSEVPLGPELAKVKKYLQEKLERKMGK